jgi:hypothetical protein
VIAPGAHRPALPCPLCGQPPRAPRSGRVLSTYLDSLTVRRKHAWRHCTVTLDFMTTTFLDVQRRSRRTDGTPMTTSCRQNPSHRHPGPGSSRMRERTTVAHQASPHENDHGSHPDGWPPHFRPAARDHQSGTCQTTTMVHNPPKARRCIPPVPLPPAGHGDPVAADRIEWRGHHEQEHRRNSGQH